MFQKIEIAKDTDLHDRASERQDCYRRALSFRRAYRSAAMYGLKFGDIIKHSELSLFAPLSRSDAVTLQRVKASASEGFQLAADSFYVLQWFHASLLQSTRKHCRRAMWHSGASVIALSHAASRLFTATGRLTYGTTFTHIVGAKPLIHVVRINDNASNKDSGRRVYGRLGSKQIPLAMCARPRPRSKPIFIADCSVGDGPGNHPKKLTFCQRQLKETVVKLQALELSSN